MTSDRSPRALAGEDLSLAELLLVLRRRRWLFLGCLLLGGLCGLVALSALTPVYDAHALLIIEPTSDRIATATIATTSQTPDTTSVDSQVQILASRSLARETIAALALEADPELTGTGTERALLWPVLGRPAPRAPADPVAGFLKRLTIGREGKSHVIAVAYRSSDAAKAARIANKLAELYMAGQRARKELASRRQSGRFDEQLSQHKARLELAERQLAVFRAESRDTRSQTLGADPAEIAGLDAQLVTATIARATRETALERVRELIARGDTPSATTDLGSSPLMDNLLALKAELLRKEAELRGQYGSRHPKIQAVEAERSQLDARIAEERRALLRRFEGEVSRARAGERLLAGKLDELKGKALRREATADRTAELEREVELSRRLYETWLARAEAEERPLATVEPDSRVISEAVAPAEPSFPKPRLIMSLALTGGLLLGIAAMYVVEVGQRGLRSEREVAQVLGVPTLAMVPHLDGPRRAGIAAQDYVLERPRSRYAEALREILTGLVLRRGEGEQEPRGRVVLITSALPGEGKSTLTLSLARAAAAEGLRVMVVDADLRKPSLHELVGLQQGAGLVEVLRREASLAEVLATDPRAPLKLLPGSKRLSQPTRLLGQDGIGALLAALRPAFDLVLVDSAPLVAVVDAKLLARLADSVLFLVRWGKTRRDFCELSLRGLRESGATVAGAVLTQVDLRRHARSGAGDAGFAYARLGEYYAD
ncbi:MAG: Wzz/FepE/Etk N-terminal domain-containing protein [Geminicoccaceae bacterium]